MRLTPATARLTRDSPWPPRLQRITPDRTGAHRNEPHSKSNEPCRTGHIQSQLPLAGSHLILAADASSHRLSLSGASPRASVLSSLSPAPHLAPPCWSYSVSHSSAPVVCFSPPFPPPLVVAPPSLVVYVSLSLLLSHTRIYIYIYLRTLNNASVSLGRILMVVYSLARRLIHACEPTMNPTRDQPSERRAALYG